MIKGIYSTIISLRFQNLPNCDNICLNRRREASCCVVSGEYSALLNTFNDVSYAKRKSISGGYGSSNIEVNFSYNNNNNLANRKVIRKLGVKGIGLSSVLVMLRLTTKLLNICRTICK